MSFLQMEQLPQGQDRGVPGVFEDKSAVGLELMGGAELMWMTPGPGRA